MSSQGTQVLVQNLRDKFLEKAKESISEIPDVSEKARIHLCLKEFSKSVFLKLQECIENSNKSISSRSKNSNTEDGDDVEPVDRKLALRIASMSDKVVDLGKKLEAKRISAPAEIAEALEEELKMKTKMNGSILKAVQGNEVNVTAIDETQFKQMKQSLLNISNILPNLENHLATLLENSKQTVQAVEKFVSKEKTQVDRIIETEKFNAEKQTVIDFLPADQNETEVISCVKLAGGISSVLDKKRSFASTCVQSESYTFAPATTVTKLSQSQSQPTSMSTGKSQSENENEQDLESKNNNSYGKNNSDTRKKPRIITNIKCLRV
uniref:Uncharacterized protein n=1 Tax=Aplanochytrium stocchinoi TaxID=215587 RepID=A0A7S3V0Y9_9STRA